MGERTNARAPGRVAVREHFADPCGQSLSPHPGGIAEYDVEPTRCDQVAEVRLHAEERCAAIADDSPPSGAQLRPRGPQTVQPGPLDHVESGAVAEQVAGT